jgi:hypothetical protein
VRTSTPLDMKQLRTLNLTAPMYVKRGEVHALGPEDVSRVDGLEQLQETLVRFSRRGVPLAYVQQEAVGEVVKFYGVGGGAEYFTLIPGEREIDETAKAGLSHSASIAAEALGLEVGGGDAVVRGEQYSIVDFNDWPSFERVREGASRAIARRCLRVLRRHPAGRDLAV